MPDQPILVTGAHRTGTTWAGKMLAAAPQVAYVSEPLNALHRPGILKRRVARWYTYICPENQADYLTSFQDLLGLRYHLLDALQSPGSLRDLARTGREAVSFWLGRLRHQQALLKDPFAVFSIAWFAQQLGCRVVVTIRHPAGFASSLKRLNWPFDFQDLLAQPLLMRDHLEPFRKQMERIGPGDLLGQASLLWTMIYRVVYAARQRLPSILIVRHEDLSLDPLEGYRRLYAELGLEMNPSVERQILTSSSSENPQETSRSKVHSVKLDSRANLDSWKRRLSPEEMARIRGLTEEVAQLYYPEMPWN